MTNVHKIRMLLVFLFLHGHNYKFGISSFQVNESLLALKVNGNKIGNRGGMFFASMLQINTTLQHLDLGDCDLVSGTYSINSLWPSDTIWQQKSGSTLAQVMAWCLTAPSHYLNQCWLIISEGLWHSPEGKFVKITLSLIWVWTLLI